MSVYAAHAHLRPVPPPLKVGHGAHDASCMFGRRADGSRNGASIYDARIEGAKRSKMHQICGQTVHILRTKGSKKAKIRLTSYKEAPKSENGPFDANYTLDATLR